VYYQEFDKKSRELARNTPFWPASDHAFWGSEESDEESDLNEEDDDSVEDEDHDEDGEEDSDSEDEDESEDSSD